MRWRPSPHDVPGAGRPGLAARLPDLGVAVAGAIVGGLAGGFLVVGVTLVLKAGIDFAANQNFVYDLIVPLAGLTITALVLHGLGQSAKPGGIGPRPRPWRAFPESAIRADISGDVVESAGQEERFPWRLAPIRTLAILATVGMGCAMGTEAPAAYLGVATGAWVGDRGRRWRRLLRPAALAGGAAGVGALMGIALVGTAFMLELGRRRRAPLSLERLLAALLGGIVGSGIDRAFGLSLIRLVVPREPPSSLAQAAITALFIGAASGVISGAAGHAVGGAKKWGACVSARLAVGGFATVVVALGLKWIASTPAAVGPGTGAIVWAESVIAAPPALLAVCLLRAAATIAAVAAGGCGGVFVPFLAVGDLAGRVLAPGLGIGNDLAGAAGAAGGIAGGYRLPFTAVFMVLGVGGPPRAMLTSLATVGIASLAGTGLERALGAVKKRR
jgi:H+/Cl- antiporter ClcA